MNNHIYIEFIQIKSLHGKITHYFHFVYAVLLPIILRYIELSKTNKKITFIIDDNMGPLFRILLQLPIDIKLKPFFNLNNDIKINKEYLLPLDIHPTRRNKNLLLIKEKLADFLTYDKFTSINKWIKREITLNNLTICSIKYDIVIIERKIDISYQSDLIVIKNNKNTIKRSKIVGLERRSIINHQEFVESIKKYFPKKNILNISLEYLPLFEQYKLFNNTKIIIAQHGAALANIVFMKSNSLIIEIMTQDLLNRGSDWFVPISKICKINHLQYIVKDYFVNINTEDFKNFMIKNNVL